MFLGTRLFWKLEVGHRLKVSVMVVTTCDIDPTAGSVQGGVV